MAFQKYEIHPAANAFPMMDAERFAELKEDIRLHGLLQPIVIYKNTILDGRNRYKACQELESEGVKVKLIVDIYDGNTPWCYVWSRNAQRRDIIIAQRLAIFVKMQDHIEAELAAIEAEVEKAANEKRAEAEAEHIKSKPRDEKGRLKPGAPSNRGGTKPKNTTRGTAAKLAESAGGSRSELERQQALRRKNPELADKVASGEIRPSAAQRQVKKDEIVNKVGNAIFSADGPFDVVVIDPPWDMQKIELDVRPNQAAFDYPTMSVAELEAFWAKDMSSRVSNDCHLFCWTTQKFLPHAINLVGLWGFKYVLTMVWHKPGGFQPIGLPQYNCEFAVYARKGSPIFVDTKKFNCCFQAPRLEHSRKPDEFYDLIRRVTGGSRIDVFSREPRDGFAQFGNEIKKFKKAA